MRRHLDLLRWLQGEIQHHLPHEIMIAAWGDFSTCRIRHDIVSPLPGIRTACFERTDLSPGLQKLYRHWIKQGKAPCISSKDALGLLHSGNDVQDRLGPALHGMRSFMLHGISDKRSGDDCIYVFFSSKDGLDDSRLQRMELLLPCIDTALRRIPPLSPLPAHDADSTGNGRDLSKRENEIMRWVRKGKANAEIGSILSISEFTVRNHLHHIFRKLGAGNRAQAIARINVITPACWRGRMQEEKRFSCVRKRNS